MNPRRTPFQWVFLLLAGLNPSGSTAHAAEANPAPPHITITTTSNNLPRLIFPYPATEQYNVYSGVDPMMPLSADGSGTLVGPTFIVTNSEASPRPGLSRRHPARPRHERGHRLQSGDERRF